ncbi:type 1 glutamine amidotransferase domain-containing protein [Chloroflexota bacterium]
MKAWIVAGGIAGLGVVTYVALPKLLSRLGLHPHYKGRRYNLLGKRVLVITTSHDTLGESGKATGVYASEMTVPYYEFLDASMEVDVASIKGGEIPIEPSSLRWPQATPSDQRYLADPDLQEKVQHSLKIDNVDFTQYDLVYMAGGWGAAYDLGTSEILGQRISEAYAAGAVLGSVCHGALGFLQATDESGEPILKGRHVTAVTDKQVQELGITITPQHPETELRKAGAIFESQTAFRDMLANLTVVDGRIVTGQNQNAGAETAQEMMGMLVPDGDNQ